MGERKREVESNSNRETKEKKPRRESKSHGAVNPREYKEKVKPRKYLKPRFNPSH